MYAALMSRGCSLQQFESLMATLMRRNLVRKNNECYHVTDAGSTFIATLRQTVSRQVGNTAAQGSF